MPKVDPNQLRLKPRVEFPGLVFRDSFSNIEVTQDYRALRAVEILAAYQDAEPFIARFCGENAQPFGAVDGQPVAVSAKAFQIASVLSAAQTADEEDRYSIRDFVLFMQSNEMADGIREIFDRVIEEESEVKTRGNLPPDSGTP
jgi:hypothetical protein